ncbi:MAG: hypothetical protein IJS59_08745 [Bacteroidaceae bacterium]|nr:hypothetical protein [Bacteroidaceae bacterium]
MHTKRHITAAAMAFMTAAAGAQTVRPDSTTQGATRPDSAGVLTVQGDTLREVIIDGDRELPIEEAVRRSIGNEPRQMSLGDVLDRLSPGLNDKILHPFAFKQRQRERRRRRWLERIETIDKVPTFDELLREAYERQMREDSLARAAQQQP